MDFVPSTNLPPRGGSSAGGGVKVLCEGVGDVEGPAPGDCGSSRPCLVYVSGRGATTTDSGANGPCFAGDEMLVPEV